MPKIQYKDNGVWSEISAADVGAASSKIIVNDSGDPVKSTAVSDETKLYIDNTVNTNDATTIIKVQTTDVEWPLDEQHGGTGVSKIEDIIPKIQQEIFNRIYPVGSIYISMEETNPQTLFGGTWKPLSGRFLVGVGSNNANNNELLTIVKGETGGEKVVQLKEDETPVRVHSHNFTAPQVPEHTHELPGSAIISGTGTNATSGYASIAASSAGAKLISHSSRTNVKALSGHTWSTAARTVVKKTAVNTTNGAVGDRKYNDNNSTISAHNNLPPYQAVYMWQRTA